MAEPGGGPGTLSRESRSGRRRWVDWLLASGIGLRAAYGLAMLPLIPLLIGPHPLLLTLLSGSMVAEVAVGARVRVGDVAWPVAVLAGVPLWVLTDWLYWALGRRWGDRALVLLTRRGDPVRAARRVARAERTIDRYGAAGVVLAKFLPVPSQLLYAAAGTAGMRLTTFLGLNLLGTSGAAAIVVTLGYAFGRQAIDLIELFQRYAGATTLVLVTVLVVVLVVRRRRAA